MSEPRKGGDFFIVDNSESDWKALRYLNEWMEVTRTMDIAAGYFEIGALLALDGQWQKLDKIRILMGDEVTQRTRKAIFDGLQAKITSTLDTSIEHEKEENDFLVGVASIVNAMKTSQIECRVYSKKKFHAKAYITHPRLDVIGSEALVGSSNFTLPGLAHNIELNVRVRASGDVAELQEWFEQHWLEGEEITPKVIQVIERQIREYTMFSDGEEQKREATISALANELGYKRTGPRIYNVLDNALRTAVRRGIIANERGMLSLFARAIDEYDRTFLKDQFLAALPSRRWIERDDAIRSFARWMGYRRTGSTINDTGRSLINGLLREGRLGRGKDLLIRKT